jgi:hypothetical protein
MLPIFLAHCVTLSSWPGSACIFIIFMNQSVILAKGSVNCKPFHGAAKEERSEKVAIPS